jgi:hypothetical protein
VSGPVTPPKPSLVTPGFPDHPSGHTCVSGAIVYALGAFFHTEGAALGRKVARHMSKHYFRRLH